MNGLLEALRSISEEMRERANELNELDGWAGDGDLGVTVSTAAGVILGLLPELEEATTQNVLKQCGTAVAREAPSTAGTLIATGLLRAAQAASDAQGDAATLARLLEASRAGISELGGAQLGSKTMLDALVPAVKAATEAAARGESLAYALGAAADAADVGAKATVSMQPRHGRAGWLAERSIGHEDGGARLVAMVLAAASRSMSAGPLGAGTSG
jgi:dihydroxyacetone kinase-like protein